jgi:hypothetical protein
VAREQVWVGGLASKSKFYSSREIALSKWQLGQGWPAYLKTLTI